MNGRRCRVTGAFVLVVAVAGGIGVLPARPAEAATRQVDMANMRFSPPRLQISPGDTVVWEASDDSHTVSARDGTFDSSTRGTMDEGDQFRWRFRAPGTFAYYCRVHQNRGMQGEIVVADPSTTTTRLTPVTAAATTSTTAATTETTMPATTTTRELATSSTTSVRQFTSTTVPSGAPVMPQEPPALNPNAPVLTGSGTAVLPEAQAAARRDAAEKDGVGPAVALGVVGGLLVAAGGGAALRARGRGRRRSPPPG
jgi:plastocyanin